MSKYKGIIKQARNTETQKPIEPENQIKDEVNLCIKVDRELRRYWSIEAKKTGISMTQAMIAGLEAEFGTPDNPKNNY